MSKTIMIVDDSASLRQVASIILKGAGYELIEACDGNDALAKLNDYKVHLIISDVNMPNMDGIAFMKAVKRLPNHKFTPIIMLTTTSQEAMRQEAREAGVKAWMVKPFDKDKLLEIVSRFVLP
ncbi:MAG: response regulator [Deltaproteobacteria bacterium]|jgi:two-component system chemotaxis response regulator CheY|nr:response regulator [Deltaproteobacteria bacterium]